MSGITMTFSFIIFAMVYLGRKPIVQLFTEDAAVEGMADSCMLVLALIFIPDMV